MLENYLISISGKQEYDGDLGEINLTTYGSYKNENGKQVIAYREYGEGGGTVVTSVVKVEPDRVEMMHTGDSTRLILEKGARNYGEFDTGFGNLMLGVFTDEITSTLGCRGGDLKIRYTLDINSGFTSKNELSITVREAKRDV